MYLQKKIIHCSKMMKSSISNDDCCSIWIGTMNGSLSNVFNPSVPITSEVEISSFLAGFFAFFDWSLRR